MTKERFAEIYCKRFCIVSDYVSSTYIVDSLNHIIIFKGVDENDEVIIETTNTTINDIITEFYKIPSVRIYGIISARIWDCEKRKVIKNITDLPDADIKSLKRNQKKLEYNSQISELLQKVRYL